MESAVGRSSRARATIVSVLTLAGGASLAAVPAATLSISSHTFPIAQQGVVAVAVVVATFVSQVASAAIVEARLSTPVPVRRVRFPRWLAIASFVAVLAVVIFHDDFLVLSVCLPILLASLEIGRSVSVAEHLDSRELWSALVVGVGALAGIAVAFLGHDWGFIPLVLGIAGATAIRSRNVAHEASRADPAVRAWVMADVGITGIIYPALNSVILALLGPAPATLFAAISTVSGLLAIPINFLRIRLLKEHSLAEIVISAGSLLAAIAVIAVCEVLHVFSIFFGASWTFEATVVALAAACLWRAASILTTIPFASLRRAGKVRILTVLRAVAALVTLAAAIATVHLQQISIIFSVFLAGELFQALLYEITRRRFAAGVAADKAR